MTCSEPSKEKRWKLKLLHNQVKLVKCNVTQRTKGLCSLSVGWVEVVSVSWFIKICFNWKKRVGVRRGVGCGRNVFRCFDMNLEGLRILAILRNYTFFSNDNLFNLQERTKTAWCSWLVLICNWNNALPWFIFHDMFYPFQFHPRINRLIMWKQEKELGKDF